jgi:iron complex outermembrane receptor protein
MNIFKLLYSKSHRTPSWQELFTINNRSRVGNKDLKAEKIETFEASHIKHFSSDSFLQTTLFYIINKDQIHNYTSNNQYINSDKTNYLHGIELEYKGHLTPKDKLYLNFSYTNGSNSQNNRLSLVSNFLAKGYYTYNFKENLSLSTIIKYTSSKNRTDYDNREKLKSTTVIDTSLNYKNFSTKTNINFSIKNIFDEQILYSSKPFTYKDDYPDIGRVFMLTISRKF